MALLTLTNAEVILGYPVLADFISKCSTGTINSCEVKKLKGLDEEEVEGAYIVFLSGDNSGLDRIVNNYFSNDVGNFEFNDVDVVLDNTSVVGLVLRSFLPGVERAETLLIKDLKNKGADINNFLDLEELKELHLLRTLMHICFNYRKDTNEDDIYHASYLDFKEQYELELSRLIADYDINENGILDIGENDMKISQIVLGK
jgi:hypothetical protein